MSRFYDMEPLPPVIYNDEDVYPIVEAD